jgi:protein-disulfide isomerase-like protein with CxxC motif
VLAGVAVPDEFHWTRIEVLLGAANTLPERWGCGLVQDLHPAARAISNVHLIAEQPDKKYKVILAIQSRKVKSDGSGNETPMTLNDYIDIGIFTGKKDEEKPLYLKKERITQANQTFEILVDQMPSRAGIDPYNKLIDRIPDDNIIDIARQ